MSCNSEWAETLFEDYKASSPGYELYETQVTAIRSVVDSVRITVELLDEGSVEMGALQHFLEITTENMQKLETDTYQKIIQECLDDELEEYYGKVDVPCS